MFDAEEWGVFYYPGVADHAEEFDQLSENYNRTQAGLVSEVVSVACKSLVS